MYPSEAASLILTGLVIHQLQMIAYNGLQHVCYRVIVSISLLAVFMLFGLHSDSTACLLFPLVRTYVIYHFVFPWFCAFDLHASTCCSLFTGKSFI